MKGTAEMPQNVPKIVNYKVLNNKLGAEGYTIIETKEELIDVHNNLNGKYALGNNIVWRYGMDSHRNKCKAFYRTVLW